MICDALENLNRYRGLHKNLETAIDYLTAYRVTHDLSDLPLGRTEVDGENVFINVMDVDLKRPADAKLEIHDRYLDIQVLVRGEREAFGCGFRANPVSLSLRIVFEPDENGVVIRKLDGRHLV